MKLNYSNVLGFIEQSDIENRQNEAKQHIKNLFSGTGKGNDFLGWLNLPQQYSNNNNLLQIQETANELQKKCEIVVVIGVGGSYLGAKAVIDALSDKFWYLKNNNKTQVVFAGYNINTDCIVDLQNALKQKEWGIVVISKSGTTIEPSIAFRILRQDLEQRYGKEESKKRVAIITDQNKGVLKKTADKEGYKTFNIAGNIGGRFSVLSNVGLLPIAIAGFDIKQLIAGANDMLNNCGMDIPFEKNIAIQYATVRNELLRKDKSIEILSNYNSQLNSLSDWWQQLFAESEGKDGKGIFPVTANFTTDLHSIGQYIQQGQRIMFETVLSVDKPKNDLTIPFVEENIDQLNYLAGKTINYVNKQAEKGTIKAHVKGEVPNIHIEIPKIDEYNLGKLIFFFQISCAISGYMMAINPFDQPGVEYYKKNMQDLLRK